MSNQPTIISNSKSITVIDGNDKYVFEMSEINTAVNKTINENFFIHNYYNNVLYYNVYQYVDLVHLSMCNYPIFNSICEFVATKDDEGITLND